ncbi:MAG: FapA family protein [Brevinematia bacterium]
MDLRKIVSLLDTLEDEESAEEIEVVAFSIKDALDIASRELNTEVFNLDYEIIESGSNGFLGIGRKPYRVVVRKIGGLSYGRASNLNEESLSIDGKFFVSNTDEGVIVKIIPPQGNGKFVTYDEIVSELNKRGIYEFDERKLRKEVENPSGSIIVIGKPVDFGPEGNVMPQIEVLNDETKAFLTLPHPNSNRFKLPSKESILKLLKMENVIYGINEENIEKALIEGIFGIPIEIASWSPPEPGKDAKINYYVNVDKPTLTLEGGAVDFHKVIKIENVVKGQVLASKEPPTKGKPGKTIKGRIIPTTDGKDISLNSIAGKNVEISSDGLELIAKEQGQVVMKQGKIHIEPVLEIQTDVATETGDIDFVGNIIIRGSVRDTFKVKAGGNIDIWGTVEKAEVIADGDVIVRTGVQGKEQGKVIAGGNVFAKFIERANVIAGKDVIVSEYILHSNILSKSSVYCIGNKASIAGGSVMAMNEIYAKKLGAESWVDTLLEVGSDPELQKRHDELVKKKEEINYKISELKKELLTLQQLLQSYGSLPPDKQEKFNTINETLKVYSQEMENLDKEIKNIREQLDSAVIEAKISAKDICYPNVKIKIRDSIHICKDQYKFVTFKREGRNIIIVPYEESERLKELQKETKKVKK